MLSRVMPYMNESKKCVLKNSFSLSQFSYCLPVLMCHSRTLNSKIDRLHERYLNIVYNDNKSTYENLLVKDWSVSVLKNLHILATQLLKFHKDVSLPIWRDFSLREPKTMNYDIRHSLQFEKIKSICNGSESIPYLGPKIWNMVPSELKEMSSISTFKIAIKEWCSRNCPCRLWKKYLGNIGLFELTIYICVLIFFFSWWFENILVWFKLTRISIDYCIARHTHCFWLVVYILSSQR